jgi:hypothetical protein
MSVKRVPGIVLIASAVAFLALVFGLLVGAVIVPWIASSPALKRAFAKLPGPTPVTEIIAIRILELACAGECDPNKLTETVSADL